MVSGRVRDRERIFISSFVFCRISVYCIYGEGHRQKINPLGVFSNDFWKGWLSSGGGYNSLHDPCYFFLDEHHGLGHLQDIWPENRPISHQAKRLNIKDFTIIS